MHGSTDSNYHDKACASHSLARSDLPSVASEFHIRCIHDVWTICLPEMHLLVVHELLASLSSILHPMSLNDHILAGQCQQHIQVRFSTDEDSSLCQSRQKDQLLFTGH